MQSPQIPVPLAGIAIVAHFQKPQAQVRARSARLAPFLRAMVLQGAWNAELADIRQRQGQTLPHCV